MFPQTLGLHRHMSPAFADGPSPATRPGLCANGKPFVTDPSTGQPVCLCQLHPCGPLPLPAAHGVTAAAGGIGGGGGGGVHSQPCTSPASLAVPLPPFTASRGGEHSLGPGMLKDSLSPRSIPLGGPYTTAAIAAYHPYLYAGYDMGVRKTAVRETTGPLKAWLHEHRKNPYPTKAEKIMLAIITQMTLTQVSTWFANARRRLKKENRGQWEGGSDNDNNSHDDRDDESRATDEKDVSNMTDHYDDLSDVSVDDNDDTGNNGLPHHLSTSSLDPSHPHPSSHLPPNPHLPHFSPKHPLPHPSFLLPSPALRASLPIRPEMTLNSSRPAAQNGSGAATPKPRIWSISAIIGLDEEEGSDNKVNHSVDDGNDSGHGSQCESTCSSSSPRVSTSSEEDLFPHNQTVRASGVQGTAHNEAQEKKEGEERRLKDSTESSVGNHKDGSEKKRSDVDIMSEKKSYDASEKNCGTVWKAVTDRVHQDR